MKRAASIACVAAAGAVLGLAAPASATTFCVPNFHAGCPDNGTNIDEPSVETAMAADGSDGEADLVLVGATEVANPDSIVPQGSDELTVRGAGADQTTLTTSSVQNIVVVDLWGGGTNTRAVTIEDLEVAIPASLPADGGTAVQLSGDVLRDVRIVSRNPEGVGNGSDGVTGFIGGGTISGATFAEEAGGDMSRAIESFPSDSGPILIEDVTFDSPVSALSMSDPGGTVLARRIRVATPEQLAFASSAGTLIVQNAIVYGQTIPALLAAANSDDNATLIADHVTAINLGASNVAPAASNVFNAGTDGDANLTVSNSIFRGFAFGWQRQEFPGTTGAANLTLRYSNVEQIGTGLAPLGTLVTSNLITADPLITNLFDLHLQPGSPSIDAGDPAPGGTNFDIDGTLRPQDSDDNGSTIRDQGAYEVPDPTPPVDPGPGPGPTGGDTTPPETTIDSGPGKRKPLRKRRAAFAFSSNEAGSTFECRIDDASFAACSSPTTLKRLKRRRHTFEVRATDAAGNVDSTPASRGFRVPKRKRRN